MRATARKLAARRRRLGAAALGAAAVLTLAACAKSTTTGTSSSSSPPPASPPAASATPTPTSSPTPAPVATPAGVADATSTVMAANVPGLGTVLVNGAGRTLYRLSSEQGGKVTCATTPCTRFWPPALLPAGAKAGVAGAGVQAALLGTVTAPNGSVRLTYNTFPLYTFNSDRAPGTAAGQGIASFGGIWSALTPAGVAAVRTPAAPVASPKPAVSTPAPAVTTPAPVPSPTTPVPAPTYSY